VSDLCPAIGCEGDDPVAASSDHRDMIETLKAWGVLRAGISV
jgi:hypothetical protein